MKPNMQRLTCVIERDGSGYVSLCPELDVASQGETVEQARHNLIEALELFFETADAAEVRDRLRSEIYISAVEVRVA
jgi:predicted RNase H-like HicB family nuclease